MVALNSLYLVMRIFLQNEPWIALVNAPVISVVECRLNQLKFISHSWWAQYGVKSCLSECAKWSKDITV